MAVFSGNTSPNETLILRTERGNLLKKSRNKKRSECPIAFLTVNYSAVFSRSQEDKGRPIVLKIQGRRGEIAFGVRLRCGTREPWAAG